MTNNTPANETPRLFIFEEESTGDAPPPETTVVMGAVLTTYMLEQLRALGYFWGKSSSDGYWRYSHSHRIRVRTRDGVHRVTGFFDSTSVDHQGLIRVGRSAPKQLYFAHHCEIHTLEPFPAIVYRHFL